MYVSVCLVGLCAFVTTSCSCLVLYLVARRVFLIALALGEGAVARDSRHAAAAGHDGQPPGAAGAAAACAARVQNAAAAVGSDF